MEAKRTKEENLETEETSNDGYVSPPVAAAEAGEQADFSMHVVDEDGEPIQQPDD